MREVHYQTSEFGHDTLDLYIQDVETVLGPLPTSEGDTVVWVDETNLQEIDNINHIVGVNYLYDKPA